MFVSQQAGNSKSFIDKEARLLVKRVIIYAGPPPDELLKVRLGHATDLHSY